MGRQLWQQQNLEKRKRIASADQIFDAAPALAPPWLVGFYGERWLANFIWQLHLSWEIIIHQDHLILIRCKARRTGELWAMNPSTKHTFQHIKLTIFVKTAWPGALLLQRCPQRPLSRKLSLPRICDNLTWQYLAILHSHLQLYNLAVFSNWISIKDTHLNTQIFHVWLCFDIRYCRCIMFRTILILFCRFYSIL